jgi:hypothetical protein
MKLPHRPSLHARHLPVSELCTAVSLTSALFKRVCRGQLKCDGTHAETRFRLSAKRTSPFKSARASVQSTTGSLGVCISGSNGSNARYTMFRGSVKSTGYPLHSPVSLSLPLPCVAVYHHISTGFYNVFFSLMHYSHASLNDGNTFWEMRLQAISSLCERHRVYLHKPRQYGIAYCTYHDTSLYATCFDARRRHL